MMQTDLPLLETNIGIYEFRGEIGRGASSIVKLVYERRTNKYFACKILPRSRLKMHNLEDRFENEIRINQQIRHANVVALYDLCKDREYYYIIMELCANGELFKYVVDRGKLNEQDAKPIIIQILMALYSVHLLGICHRDLKPENILITEQCFIKISDFGLSKFVDRNGLVTTPCGSPCYTSPECISGKPYDGRKSDIWSCGVILYAMLTGQLPWTKRNQNQLFDQIKRGDYTIPTYLSEDCRSFISGLMTVNPDERFTIPEAMQHVWLNSGVTLDLPIKFTSTPTPSLRKLDQFFDRELSVDTYADIDSGMSDPSLTTLDGAKKSLCYKTKYQFPNFARHILRKLSAHHY